MHKAVSLYLHIPYCLSKCDYCDFFSIPVEKCPNKIISDEYVDAVCAEMQFRINNYKTKLCKSVYIGGGTPSLLNANQFSKICNTLFSLLEKTSEFEFTCEVNPDDVTQKLLNDLEKNGVNRISCGIQSLNDAALKNVNRRAGRKENLSALECFSKYWKHELSIDLICGLPMETQISFIEGLESIIKFKPDHISMYSLTIEEETPLGQLVSQEKIDYDFTEADELWLKSKSILEEKGYLQYEVSNFCKKGKECKHNITYWNHEDYLGIGSGGTGTIYDLDGTGFRWTNSINIDDYINFWLNAADLNGDIMNAIPQITETVNLENSVFEYFMMGLRKLSGISNSDFYEKFGFAMPEKIVKVFEKWRQNNLADIEFFEDKVIYRLNHNGILLLNKFLEEL